MTTTLILLVLQGGLFGAVLAAADIHANSWQFWVLAICNTALVVNLS